MAAACALLVPQRPKGKLGLKPVSALSPIRFREVAQQSGLDFVLHNNPTPRKHMIETMAGGLAAFDYNNDGKVDIFFTNGAAIPSLEKESPKFFNRLYRNDGGMKFTDVTLQAGVAGEGYSMGRRCCRLQQRWIYRFVRGRSLPQHPLSQSGQWKIRGRYT